MTYLLGSFTQNKNMYTVQPSSQGALHIISGTMFGGKTSELIKRAKENPGLIFNHKLDMRYGECGIFSHSGEYLQCVSISSLEEIPSTPNYECTKHIYIDEFQFFKDSISIIQRMVEDDNKIVTCSGLLVDTNRVPFGNLLYLVPLSDTYVEKKGICCEKTCLKPGLFVTNKNTKESCVNVGFEQYILLCRYHYLKVNQ
jgi:thymidine kinase